MSPRATRSLSSRRLPERRERRDRNLRRVLDACSWLQFPFQCLDRRPQPRLYSTEWITRTLGDFAVRQTFEISQLQSGALLFRKLVERALHAPEQFLLRYRRFQIERHYDRVLEQLFALFRAVAPQSRDRTVARDHREPARERSSRRIKIGSSPPELIENVLQN